MVIDSGVHEESAEPPARRTPRFPARPAPIRAALLLVAIVLGGAPLALFAAEKRSAAASEEAKSASRLEQVVFHDAMGMERKIAGRVLLEAADGGLLVEGRDGRLWTVEKEHLASRESTDQEFAPLAADDLGRQVAEELGGNCEIVVSRHYVICSRAGKAYAQWCGALFERLYGAFQNYWKQRGMKLHEPEFPLIALVFANEKQFIEFATADAGPEAAAAKGYYSIGTNRIVLYDLTASNGNAAPDPADISRRLAATPFNVATVVHEATHQIAFNSGMHTRYADNPLWLTEGMAMFFETPDLTSRSGWKTVGAVNDFRLRQFQAGLARRPDAALRTLIESDTRFTDPKTMKDAYAEAWALSYFLIKTRKQDYVEYLSRIARKPRLMWDDPGGRVKEFQAAFGDDLKRFDGEFIRFMRRVK
jgi:hypothetical protein